MNMSQNVFVARTLLVAVLVTLSICQAYAVSLGPDCEPSGLIAKGKEAWNPKEFWTEQIQEIQEYVEGQRTAYRLSMIDRKRDKVNERLDEEEMMAMGIESYSDPELDRLLEETDRKLLQMDRDLLQHAVEWGRKCTAYAEQELSRLQ